MERYRSVLGRWLARGAVTIAGCVGLVGGVLSAPAGAATRAFELVTPLGSLAQIEGQGAFSLDDGNTVFFTSGDPLVGSTPNGPMPTSDSYMSRRGPDGWTTTWVTDVTQDEPGTIGSRTMFSNEDGSLQVLATENRVDPGDTFAHSVDGYLRELTPDGPRFTWVTPGERTTIEHRSVLAATPDLRALLIATTAAMVPEDTNDASDLYLIRDGEPELLVQTDEGTGVFQHAPFLAVPNTLLADGRTVFFTTSAALVPEDTDTLRDLYRRDASGRITLLSPNRRSTPLGVSRALEVTFAGFSSNGDVACFLTREPLVEDLTVATHLHVYCYTVSTDTLELVTVGAEDTTLRGLAMSDDGSTVVFATRTALTDDDVDGGLSLYVHRRDTRRHHYVGPLAANDTERGHVNASTIIGRRGIRISPDGTEMFFVTAAQMVAEDVDGDADVYRWTLDRGTELISSAPGAGISVFGSTVTGSDMFTDESVHGRVMTDGGGRMFFISQVPHVPEDTDGGYYDVYEWSEEEGIRLITPAGDAPYDAFYLDNSADGSSVFFITSEPIDRRDDNAARDVYVSRVDGGFEIPPSIPGCTGENCQGPLVAPPALPQIGSAAFAGAGNVVEPARAFPRHQVLRLTRRQLRTLARKGRTTVRVRVNAPGAIRVRAFARIRRKRVVVAAVRSATARAATVRVPLKLSRRARAHLRTGRALRVTLTVRYSESDVERRRVVRLRG